MAGSTPHVTDRPPALTGHDVFSGDRALVDAVERHVDAGLLDEVRGELAALGRACGSAQVQEWGVQAEAHPPVPRTHDRHGRRIDEVGYHPAWDRLLGKGVGAGLTAAWTRPAGHVRRAAAYLLWTQVDAGMPAALTPTHAAVPALRAEPVLAAEWEPRLTSTVHDIGARPARLKAGALCATATAGRGTGGDGAPEVRAAPLAEDGCYALSGLAWFCSAPTADAFLVLAGAPGGPTCFLVPRVLDDGSRNPVLLQRLKDLHGHRSGGVAELEFAGARARRVGEEGGGALVLGGTVTAGRLDCVLSAAGLMRQAVARAVHHCAHRASAAGGALADRPLMRTVLADLAVESEAATALALRLASAWDDDTEEERALLRIAVPAAAYGVTRRAVSVVTEAAECLGGDGFVEESGMPRLLREAPMPVVRAGGGNTAALDVVRVLRGDPAAFHACLTEIGRARGADHRFDAAVRDLLTDLADLDGVEARARRLAERLVLLLQGALLVRCAPPEVADAFCASRLGHDAGAGFGTLPATLDLASVVERARPAG